MNLAFLMGLYTAQRQGDLLRLPWSAWDGECITLCQSKTGANLIIPVFERLNTVLKQTPRRSPIILTDANGLPWARRWFNEQFKRTTTRAGLKDRWFLDLRRTAIVRLAETGCKLAEITAISGHKITYCQDILETYLPRTRAMAVRAVKRMN